MNKWFEHASGTGSNVVSSRVRLTRNWSDYVFPSRLSEESAREMVGCLKEQMGTLMAEEELQYFDFEKISDLDRRAMRERRLINQAMVGRRAPSGLVISPKEDVSIVLNGTDHIRIQVQFAGLCLEKVWEKANEYDDRINENISYAYDEKYGYLTSFPTNVGTGMRASVVIHLPMLSQGKKFNSLVADMSRFGVSVKGRVNAVMVQSLDRRSHDLTTLYRILRFLQNHDAVLITTKTNLQYELYLTGLASRLLKKSLHIDGHVP